MGNIVRLTVAANATHTDFIVSLLAADGIVAEAHLSDMAVAITLGAAPGSAARGDGGMRFILVNDADLPRAQGLLAAIPSEHEVEADTDTDFYFNESTLDMSPMQRAASP